MRKTRKWKGEISLFSCSSDKSTNATASTLTFVTSIKNNFVVQLREFRAGILSTWDNISRQMFTINDFHINNQGNLVHYSLKKMRHKEYKLADRPRVTVQNRIAWIWSMKFRIFNFLLGGRVPVFHCKSIKLQIL